MSLKPHILFVVPDGVGIKNYLYSDVLKHLVRANAKISIWSPLPESVFDEVKLLHNIEIGYKQLVLKKEPVLTRFYREATTYARLLHNTALQNNATILSNWNIPKQNLRLKLLYQSAMQFGRYLAKDYKRIVNYETKSRQGWSKTIVDDYVKDLESFKPTYLFITHQRVASLMPICIAAKTLGINVNTVIFSWDNLPKARLCVWADQYLVWSEWMQQEMKQYYPEIKPEQVVVTGTPQFEFYKNKNNLIDRIDFANQYGLNPAYKWICFSGDDKLTSPNDPMYLADIADSIKDKDVQILFRRCPVDVSKRYDEVLKKFTKNIVEVNPDWNLPDPNKNWGAVFPKYSDIRLLVNVVYHCDMVINVGSTMAHDFAMFDKPTFYINYDQNTKMDWSVDRIYKYQHFRSMEGLDAVGWLYNKQEIKDKILAVLEIPEKVGVDRKKWMERIVTLPVEKASYKIAHILTNA